MAEHLKDAPLPPPLTGTSIAPTGAFPGSLTPGWNDPPPLSGDNASSRRPRLDLRKRVAYPMDGATQTGLTTSPLARPVAMVSPQCVSPPPNCGSNNVTTTPRLPPLAQTNANLSNVQVAVVTPRQK